MTCLHCQIIDLIAAHVRESQDRGQLIDVAPVVQSVAGALGQLIGAAGDPAQRTAMLVVAAGTIKAWMLDTMDGARPQAGPVPSKPVGGLH